VRTITATEASRNFAGLLDAVEAGETVVITRGGRRIARIVGDNVSNGRALKDFLGRFPPDPGWAAEVRATRDIVRDDRDQWHD